MKLSALVMSRDQPSLRVLAAVLEVLEIDLRTCLSSNDAIELLVHGHHSAVVLDFDLPGASLVARMARMVTPHRRPVVFGTVSAFTAVGGAFQHEVNFILYKPMVCEQVMRSLCAGQALMKPNPRRSSRHPLEALVYLQCGATALPAIVLDLSEQGLALQAPEPLSSGQDVPLRFVLPGTSQLIEATGEIIWSEDNGRAGVFFSGMTADSRNHLRAWLAKHGTKGKNAVRALLPPHRAGRTPRTAH
jgi:hypothetical protein